MAVMEKKEDKEAKRKISPSQARGKSRTYSQTKEKLEKQLIVGTVPSKAH